MWTVIYIAPSLKQAELIRNRLDELGFMVKIQPSRISKSQFEILIPHGEVDEVQEIMSDVLQIGRE
ncbi:glutamate decarboxylase [Alicyclobacillaceae bacterium I2511]|nr:glutamate decarboxylase [Alicyclobacillaceae bacterium I2511]